MKLPRALYEEMKTHVLFDAPREACGIIATQDDEAVELYRAYNVAKDPTQGYLLAAADQLWITQEIERRGLELGIVYHSHPMGAAVPSRGDIRGAYPGVLQVIVGMSRGLVTRAYEFRGLRVTEVPLEVYDA